MKIGKRTFAKGADWNKFGIGLDNKVLTVMRKNIRTASRLQLNS